MRTLAVFSFPVCVQTGGLLSCLCHSSLKNTSWTLGHGVRDRMRAGRPASQQATPLRGAGIIPSTSTSFQSSSLVPVCCTLILLAADGLCVSSALPWGCGMRGGRGTGTFFFYALPLASKYLLRLCIAQETVYICVRACEHHRDIHYKSGFSCFASFVHLSRCSSVRAHLTYVFYLFISFATYSCTRSFAC